MAHTITQAGLTTANLRTYYVFSILIFNLKQRIQGTYLFRAVCWIKLPFCRWLSSWPYKLFSKSKTGCSIFKSLPTGQQQNKNKLTLQCKPIARGKWHCTCSKSMWRPTQEPIADSPHLHTYVFHNIALQTLI